MAISFCFEKNNEEVSLDTLDPEDPVRNLIAKAMEIEPAINSAMVGVGLGDTEALVAIGFSIDCFSSLKARFDSIRAGILPRDRGVSHVPLEQHRHQRFLAANIFEALIHDDALSGETCQVVARAADLYFATEAKKLMLGATVVDVLPDGTLLLASGGTSIAVSPVGLDWEGEEDVNTYLFVASLNPDSVTIIGGFEAVIAKDWPTTMLP